MFFIAYAFKGQVHVFAGRVKIVSHLSCRTSAILKYFCPLHYEETELYGCKIVMYSHCFCSYTVVCCKSLRVRVCQFVSVQKKEKKIANIIFKKNIN